MEPNKIVVHYQDGTVKKGKTSDFFPTKKNFHLELLDGNIIVVDTEQLKAIFFVKDYTGNKEHVENYSYPVPGGGRKIRVDFCDGETIIGYTQGYSPDRTGFFIMPADKQSNNQRMFILKSATKKVEFI